MDWNRSRETEVAPSSSSFSLSEKLALNGSTGLSGMELLVLLVGKESVANALVRHFGSLRALSCASFLELRQFLPRRKAEAVMAALWVANIAEAEHALSAPLNNAEAIYKANLEMKAFLRRSSVSFFWIPGSVASRSSMFPKEP